MSQASESRALATYRLQFNRGLTFDQARGLAKYFSRLGVTHVYCSPVLRARLGSTHGYDVVDPTTLNPELGDETAFRAMSGAFQAHGVGVVLDIVPNHMAASSTENPFWQDVLAYGPSSPYARWFDIDWRLPDPELWGRVLVPVLGEPLLRVLSRGELQLVWQEGRFKVCYFDHQFPIDPATVPMICAYGIDSLQSLLGPKHPDLRELRDVLRQLRALPRRATRMRRQVQLPVEDARKQLSRLAHLVASNPQVDQWLQQTIAQFANAEKGPERLRRLLDAQCYRLVYWRRAARAINYRRFFDINDLVSIRQEDPEVFQATHAVVGRWIHEGLVDGLRIDHLDGLRDPAGYLRQLRELAPSTGSPPRPPLIFVEKILAHDEGLRSAWPVEGTTGYAFANQVESIFIHPQGFAEIEENYRRMLGRPVRFDQYATWGKQRVLRNDLSAFVGRLADSLLRLAQTEVTYAALTKRQLVDAIVEVAVGLPVYRTYIDSEAVVDPDDRHRIQTACSTARKSSRAVPEAIDFLEHVLLLEDQAGLPEEGQQRLSFVQRFQQLTGPAAAKGIEDTALYAYVPLVSRNEVGNEPDVPLEHAVEDLHQANLARAEEFPREMLAATTHDTKRTADVRARLDVLSEMPKVWNSYVSRWRQMNRVHRRPVRGKLAPDPATEYLFYQSVIGIWPAGASDKTDPEIPDPDTLRDLRQRIEQYMLKAAREAKTRTSWVNGNAQFEEALVTFVRSCFMSNLDSSASFLTEVNRFVSRIARPGFWNALSRTLIQYTSPGTPDLYQGDEMWNFALVDPDNRLPVDFPCRQQQLDELLIDTNDSEGSHPGLASRLVDTPEDGRIKLYLIMSLLRARRKYPRLFSSGTYEPLEISGPLQEHLFGFIRVSGDQTAIVLAPRWTATLSGSPTRPPIGAEVWEDETVVHLPPQGRPRAWKSWLTGETIESTSAGDDTICVADALRVFPGALLV